MHSWFPFSPPQSSQFGAAVIAGHIGVDAVPACWEVEMSLAGITNGCVGDKMLFNCS